MRERANNDDAFISNIIQIYPEFIISFHFLPRVQLTFELFSSTPC